LPAKRKWDEAAGRWRNDELAAVRAQAAVSMAGVMAEAMLEGLPVPDYEDLLTRESADPLFDKFEFEYGSLEEVFNHAVAVFGDHDVAARWLVAALPGIYSVTHEFLEQNWPDVLQRARKLDLSLKRNAA
jgi:hypothetical protein